MITMPNIFRNGYLTASRRRKHEHVTLGSLPLPSNLVRLKRPKTFCYYFLTINRSVVDHRGFDWH